MGSCASKQPKEINPSGNVSNAQVRRDGQRKALKKPSNANSTVVADPNITGSNGSATSETIGNDINGKVNLDHNTSADSSNEVEKQTNTPTTTLTNGTVPAGNGSTVNGSQQQQPQQQQPVSINPVDVAAAQSQSDSNEVKLLLLGSGESGKSTIVKQMKILHQNGYTPSELQEYKPFVYKNILDCIKNVINAVIDLQPDLINKKDEVKLIEEENGEQDNDEEINDEKINNDQVVKNGNKLRKHILEYDDLNDVLDYEFSVDSEQIFNPDIAKKIKQIYNTPEIEHFIKFQQGKFYLIDSTHYFLSDIDRITNPDYVPSVNDILRTRKKTSGIFDFKFEMGSGLNIHMYDVGGQRSERKKWIHCFDNVTLIIFCVALSEYDQTLLEESSQNRLEESLALFDSVVNSRWFARTSIVLFLNKIDVFAEKLKYSPLEDHFPEYTGGDNINKAAKYILWKFNQVNRSGLNIYPHVTQATDTSNIQLVMAAVKETLLENSLKDSGLLQTT
ncbi:guanine nucleotide binding protein, alpha subunit [Scheffersomyces amazonensis]|uniref:guanine nucleotide binding protein, alpha subunit n=1 Tax=Scheffersomyces amazonensis TaxID=1078765 RepID=UPI00315CD54B